MTRILEVDAEKAVEEFSLDRDLEAWPWTIEAMMKDFGDLAEEPELYAAVKDYLLGEYKQRAGQLSQDRRDRESSTSERNPMRYVVRLSLFRFPRRELA